MPIAIRASVTVSIALDTIGAHSVMRFVRRLEVFASDGITSVCSGRSMTSSYVSPVRPKGSLPLMDSPLRKKITTICVLSLLLS